MPTEKTQEICRVRHRSRRLIALTWLVLGLLAGPISAYAQSAGALSLTVFPAKTRVSLREPLPLMVVINNVSGRQSVALRGAPSFSAAGGLELVVTDGRSPERRLMPQRSEQTLAQVQAGSRRVVLAPQRGLAVELREKAARLFPQPGHYQLVVNYRSPQPTPGNTSVQTGVLEGSSASSAVLEIDVVQ